MPDLRVTIDVPRITFPRDATTEDWEQSFVEIVGWPDGDELEPGQVQFDFGDHLPTMVFWARDLLWALRPFDPPER